MLFPTEDGDNNEAGGSGAVNQSSPSVDDLTSNSSSSSNYSSSGDEDMEQAVKFNYVKQKFVGHRNARTMIKEANFWGDNFVS